MRLDLPRSYVEQDEWLRTLERRTVRRSRASSFVQRTIRRIEPYRVREALVNSGLRRTWFEEFRAYWEGVLGGRPLSVMDFHQLRFLYRRRQHSDARYQLEWGSPEQHLQNWQLPRNLSQTFEFVYRDALHSGAERGLLVDVLRPGTRVLEYGCGIAPMYRAWRTYCSHVDATWVLADIPGFSFHYCRDALGRDAEVDFCVISDLGDPLAGVSGDFQLIIAQAVFEHLDHPRAIAEYLLQRLSPGGFLWFTFSVTGATGLDTPSALDERQETLQYLSERLEIVHGDLRLDTHSLGTCIGRRR